jgi:penicillin-binding protein 2
MDGDSPRLRLSILGIVVFGLFATLFVRLYYLQVMSPDDGQLEAAANRGRVIQEEAPRGRILDAKGRVIVDNRTSLVVTMEPQELQELEEDERKDVILRLATELTLAGSPTKVTTIERRLADPQYSPIQPIPVAIDVSEDLMVYLAERADDFPSVAVHRESVREYPHGSLAAHVVGYVGRISDTELAAKMGTEDDKKTIPKPYEPDSSIGKTGIERTFEDDLRGTPGIRRVEIDSDGKVVREVSYQRPVAGNDVQLTIDLDVQEVTETKLAAQLAEARNTYTSDYRLARAPAGSAIVLDPNTGNVIAMASYPTYDPSEFVNGISTDRYQQLTGGEAVDNPLVNRAIEGLYAPGSTFKVVTATAGMKAGIITAGTPVYDQGFIEIGGREFTNAKRQQHGSVQLSSSLTVSSDVYYYLIGAEFWNNRDAHGDGIQNTARDFGFGAPSGIQLPGELAGVIPDPAWKRQLFEAMTPEEQANGDPNWYTGNSVNLSIGQGDMLATPLQMANSYAALVDAGTIHRPNLVLRVLKPKAVEPDVDPATLGKDGCDPAADDCPIVRTVDNGILKQFDLPPSIAGPIEQGLEGVAANANGTAYQLFQDFDLAAWPVLAKTGTAEVQGKADNSLFVAVGPGDDPQYVAAVVLEEAGFGAEVAGPVVKTIFEHVSGQAEACATDPEDEGGPSTTVPVVSDAPIIETDDCALPDGDGGTTALGGTDTSGAGTGTGGTTATTVDPSGTGATTPTTSYVTPTTAYVPPPTAYVPPTTAYVPPTTTVPTTLATTQPDPGTTGTGGTGEGSPTPIGALAGPAIPVLGLGAIVGGSRRRRRTPSRPTATRGRAPVRPGRSAGHRPSRGRR